MHTEPPAKPIQSGHLTLWDTVSIIIGIVIGAGIYETAPYVLQNVPNPAVAIGVWVAGGLLSLVGALCYAELATTFPRSGGDYVYLTNAYGRIAGFLFGWCQLTVLMTGSIGMMAYIFADYAARLWQLGAPWKPALAATAVLVFTWTNLVGLIFGKRTQNLLTLLKVLGIGGIVVAGFLWAKPAAPIAAAASAGGGSIGLAMILVLYTYGGWNDAALVASEIHDRRRNIPRALVLGTVLLTLIYVLVNAAYILGLGFEGARNSGEVAADLFQVSLGGTGAAAMSLLVMISALGAINGLIYTGSRVYASLGADYRWFEGLARWHPTRKTPVISLTAQGAISLLLVLLVGTNLGQAALNGMLSLLAMGGIEWEGHGGFETLLRATAPVFWLFFLGTGLSLFVLRWRDPTRPRPFRVPLYPFTPALFCAMCIYMLYSATVYAGKLLLLGLIPLILGVITYLIGGKTASIVPQPSNREQETIT
jgi:basic amino acid/polyamine antiporter, APA family